MQPDLPDILRRYYAAQNAHDIDAMAACFAPDVHVRDEGRDYDGRDAARAWKRETSAKYHVHAEPLTVREEGGETVVVARVAGDFPGSPADLDYRFGLSADGLIATLRIG